MVKILIKNGADTNLISRFSRALGKDGVIMSCASYDPQILSFVFDELEGVCFLFQVSFFGFLISQNLLKIECRTSQSPLFVMLVT